MVVVIRIDMTSDCSPDMQHPESSAHTMKQGNIFLGISYVGF